MGYSRQQFYEIRHNFQTYGAQGLIDRLPGVKRPHPNRGAPEIEAPILVHSLLTKHEYLLRLEKETSRQTVVLTEEQIRQLERFSSEFRKRHIEAPYMGALLAVDTFFVGSLKGIGKIYMQSAIDRHSRHAWARLYTSKLPMTAAHILNNDIRPSPPNRHQPSPNHVAPDPTDSRRLILPQPSPYPTTILPVSNHFQPLFPTVFSAHAHHQHAQDQKARQKTAVNQGVMEKTCKKNKNRI